MAIAATSTQETDKTDVQRLIEVLRDAREDSEVRRSAYVGLNLLRPGGEFPDALTEFDPATNVDWTWIALVESTAR